MKKNYFLWNSTKYKKMDFLSHATFHKIRGIRFLVPSEFLIYFIMAIENSSKDFFMK
jgi:hypothetical protein